MLDSTITFDIFRAEFFKWHFTPQCNSKSNVSSFSTPHFTILADVSILILHASISTFLLLPLLYPSPHSIPFFFHVLKSKSDFFFFFVSCWYSSLSCDVNTHSNSLHTLLLWVQSIHDRRLLNCKCTVMFEFLVLYACLLDFPPNI